MLRKGFVAGFVVLGIAAAANAQTEARFRWQAGQTLTYRVEQKTQAAEVVNDVTANTKTQLNLTKRWTVAAVGADGAATLHLAILALRIETTTPSGEALAYDSTSPEKGTPALREQMEKFVGPTLAVLRVDGQGRVLDVKESKFGPATRYESEPPFVGVLPGVAPEVGQAWARSYNITLAPPQGTGEKFPAVQKYTCQSVEGDRAIVQVTTEVKDLPAAPADQLPLLQSQPTGTIVFDLKNGRLESASLKIEKELKNHQGEGSSYKFTSSYVEQVVKE